MRNIEPMLEKFGLSRQSGPHHLWTSAIKHKQQMESSAPQHQRKSAKSSLVVILCNNYIRNGSLWRHGEKPLNSETSTIKDIFVPKTQLTSCRNPGLNQGPLDLQSNALPTELFRHKTHYLGIRHPLLTKKFEIKVDQALKIHQLSLHHLDTIYASTWRVILNPCWRKYGLFRQSGTRHLRRSTT